MNVRIDARTCTGHGRCYSVAPELFDADDRGYGVVLGAPVGASDDSAARRAADSCPEGAIHLDH